MTDNNKPSLLSSYGGNSKQQRVLLIVVLSFIVLALIVGFLWFFWFRFWVSTDDAYVDGHRITLNSQVSATVLAYYADNTDLVEEGQLLVELDPTDYLIAFEKAKSSLEIAIRNVVKMKEAIGEAESTLALERARLKMATQDFEHRAKLVDSKAVSRETFEHSQADFDVAKASVSLAEHKLTSALVKFGEGTLEEHPEIVNAIMHLKEAYINTQRCNILAPATGYVAMRSVEIGKWVQPSSGLMSIVPLEEIWVTANFKETELEKIRIGQPVKLITDLYGHSFPFHGKIIGLQPGTGSVFTLLPPQNATGNWIKIVQRVPVRVSIELDEIKKHPLLLGLSVYAEVEIEDLSGPVLAPYFSKRTVASTQVYSVCMDEVDELIESLLEANVPKSLRMN